MKPGHGVLRRPRPSRFREEKGIDIAAHEEIIELGERMQRLFESRFISALKRIRDVRS